MTLAFSISDDTSGGNGCVVIQRQLEGGRNRYSIYGSVSVARDSAIFSQKTGAPQRTDFFCYPIWSGAEKSDEKLCTSLCLAGCRRKDPLDE